MHFGAPLFVSASSGRRAKAREKEGLRMKEREKKEREKKERSSSMIPLTRLSSVSSGRQAGRQGTSERTFHSMNRKEEEMTKRRWGRAKGKASTGDDDDEDSARRKVGRLITR